MNATIEQINETGHAFAEFALPMLIQSGVLILILLLVDLLLRRRVRAVFRYWLWMLVLVKLVLPASLSSPVSVGRWFGDELAYVDVTPPPAPEPKVDIAPMPVAEAPPVTDISRIETITRSPAVVPAGPIPPQVEPAIMEPEPVVLLSPPATPLSWQGMALLVWLTVLTAMVLVLLQRALYVKRLVTKAAPADGRMADLLAHCYERMAVRSKVGLKISAEATSPAVCGLFHPVILVPKNLTPSLSSGELRVVLLHELAHIKRRDLWVNLAQTILQIFYFYNPPLWLANVMIRRAREQAVDEMVLVAMGEEARQYPQTLVNVAKLAFKRPALSLRLIGVVESRSVLTGRIKHILNRPLPKTAKLGLVGLLIIVVIATILLPMAAFSPGPPELIVRGVVRDAQTGEPIAGVRVFDDGYGPGPSWDGITADQQCEWGAITNAAGEYSFLTWPEHHSISVEAPGYTVGRESLYDSHFTFRKKNEETIDFDLEPEAVEDTPLRQAMNTDLPAAEAEDRLFTVHRTVTDQSGNLEDSVSVDVEPRSNREQASKGIYKWRIMPPEGFVLDHGWFSLVNGQMKEHSGGGRDRDGMKKLTEVVLETTIIEGNLLALKMQRIYQGPDSGTQAASVTCRTTVPEGSEFASEHLSRFRPMTNTEYRCLWEGRFVRDGETVKTVVYCARIAAVDDEPQYFSPKPAGEDPLGGRGVPRTRVLIDESRKSSPRTDDEISGRVVDEDGLPAAGAQVSLSTDKLGVQVSHGKFKPMPGDVESRIVETDSQGDFDLGEAPAEGFDLIAVHDKGSAIVGSEEYLGSREIRLQPWGRIEGQLAQGRNASGNKIWMAGLPNSTWLLHRRDYRYEIECDADGHFVLGKVPAGWFEVGYLIRIGDSGWSITSRTPVEVAAGETAKMMLGGSGRPVVGKFVPPEGYDKSIYFGNGLRSLGRTRPDEPRPENYDRMTRREQEQWRAQWRKSDEFRQYRDAYWHDPNWRQYTFGINDDGSFQIEDVIAGKYDFTVWIEERITGAGRPDEIGSYYDTIEVPEMPGGRSDEPLDLGELELAVHEPLRVGDAAPLFEAKTLDGKDLKLIDYRGKFVLLSFWQPVSHPEIERLRELYDTYNPDGRLEIIGLAGHDTLEEVRNYLKENPVPWPQIYTSEEFKAGVAKDYRIPGLPWIFLIDPDGKIVASGLRGEKLKSAVRKNLEDTSDAKRDMSKNSEEADDFPDDLRVNEEGIRAAFPDSGSGIMRAAEARGLNTADSLKFVKIYDSVRRPFHDLQINRIQLTEDMYKRSREKFEDLVATPNICSIYARRWLVILDWLAEKIDARQAAKQLADMSSTLSDVHEASFTRACAMTILARDGHMTPAREIFAQCRPELTPQWGWFVFDLHREFNEHVASQTPNVDRAVGNRIVQTARTTQQWQEIEEPLHKAQTAYADYLEHDFLPMAARYITSISVGQYPQIDHGQVVDALRQLTVSHHRSFLFGATTDQIEQRVTSRILPKVLAAWQRSLDLVEYPYGVAAQKKEIAERCKKLGISEDSLPRWWQELIAEKEPAVNEAPGTPDDDSPDDVSGVMTITRDNLFEVARSSNYKVGPEWFRVAESSDNNIYMGVERLAETGGEPRFNEVLDDWVCWKYDLDKVVDMDSAMALFQTFCDQFDVEQEFDTEDPRPRAIKLICDKLNTNELISRHIKALDSGRGFYSDAGIRDAVLSINEPISTGHKRADVLPASASAVWYALRRADEKLDAQYPKSRNIIEDRLTLILIQRYEKQEDLRRLDRAVLLGGPAIAEFLLQKDWRDERGDDNRDWEHARAGYVNKWLLRLISLDDPAGEKFRAEHKDIVVKYADMWAEKLRLSEFEPPRFLLLDRHKGTDSFAWQYWTSFSANIDRASLFTLHHRLRWKFEYLKMLEPFTTTRMYLDCWLQVLDELEGRDVDSRLLMHGLPAHRKRPLTTMLLAEITERLEKIGPHTEENHRVWSQLNLHRSILSGFLNKE